MLKSDFPTQSREERHFPLNVTVFNFIDVELPIRVKLITSEEEVQSDKTEFDICIGPKDNKVITMKTTGLKLGELNVTVEARITNGINDCKSVGEGNGFTDALVKQLRVKPEGVEIEKDIKTRRCLGTIQF